METEFVMSSMFRHLRNWTCRRNCWRSLLRRSPLEFHISWLVLPSTGHVIDPLHGLYMIVNQHSCDIRRRFIQLYPMNDHTESTHNNPRKWEPCTTYWSRGNVMPKNLSHACKNSLLFSGKSQSMTPTKDECISSTKIKGEHEVQNDMTQKISWKN